MRRHKQINKAYSSLSVTGWWLYLFHTFYFMLNFLWRLRQGLTKADLELMAIFLPQLFECGVSYMFLQIELIPLWLLERRLHCLSPALSTPTLPTPAAGPGEHSLSAEVPLASPARYYFNCKLNPNWWVLKPVNSMSTPVYVFRGTCVHTWK